MTRHRVKVGTSRARAPGLVRWNAACGCGWSWSCLEPPGGDGEGRAMTEAMQHVEDSGGGGSVVGDWQVMGL